MDLEDRLRRQHGVVSYAQAREAGLTKEAIRWRVSDGEWTRIAQGLFRLTATEYTWTARAHALSLRLGKGGALTLDTATHLHGLEQSQPSILTGAVVDRQVGRLVGTRVARRPRLEVVMREGLPVTSARETALDSAAQYAPGQWRDIVHGLARWVRSRKTSGDDILEALEQRGRYPHRELVVTALGPIREGVESVLELEALDGVVVRHGLPRPTLQAPVLTPAGVARRDALWDEFGVALEVDGELFHTGASLQRDRRRDRHAARAGTQTLRAGHVEIVYGPCELAVDIFLTLRTRGYPGSIVPCGPSCPARAALLAG